MEIYIDDREKYLKKELKNKNIHNKLINSYF